jgi:hypothetical protein
LKAYRLHQVSDDRYAGEWPRERFRVHGVEYVPAEKPKSDPYRDALPLFNAHRVELLDHPRLVAQLCGLERRTARGGRDSIDHVRGGHDDVANCVASALVRVAAEPDELQIWLKAFGDPEPPVVPSRPAAPPDTIRLRLHNGVDRRWNHTKNCWQDELEKENANG